MKNFTFKNQTKIIFGRGTESTTGKEARLLGSRALLHYGQGSVKKSGLLDRVKASMEKEGISITELPGVKPNPRLALVREGISLCREKKIDMILAVGGGSVIDSAKAIAAGVFYDGDIWDCYTGKGQIGKSLPIGVVLTIPAAGSESSTGSVITEEETHRKLDAMHPDLRPVFSVMNPELTFTLPPYQTACGVADMMAHILERYFTNEKNVAVTDRLSEGLLKTIIESAPKAIKNPLDYDARAEIMWAGTLAHNDLLGTGREEDWSSHMIEHELSALFDVAHGAGLSVIFPAWMKYVYKENIERFVQFAERVWDVPLSPSREETALAGIEKTKSFFQSIGLPVTLKGLGITDSSFSQMAENCIQNNGGGTIGSFKKLSAEDISKIYALSSEDSV